MLGSPAGAATTLIVSQSLPRASIICAVPLEVLWNIDYGLSLPAVLLILPVCCSWEKSQCGAPKLVLQRAGEPLAQRVLSADYLSQRADARTDFKAGNTQTKFAVFLDKLVEMCRFCIFFFLLIYIFSNASFILKWKLEQKGFLKVRKLWEKWLS